MSEQEKLDKQRLDYLQRVVERNSERNRKIRSLVYLGLTTDGAHHKQWCLYRIGKLLRMNLTYDDGDPLDEGIAP